MYDASSHVINEILKNEKDNYKILPPKFWDKHNSSWLMSLRTEVELLLACPIMHLSETELKEYGEMRLVLDKWFLDPKWDEN